MWACTSNSSGPYPSRGTNCCKRFSATPALLAGSSCGTASSRPSDERRKTVWSDDRWKTIRASPNSQFLCYIVGLMKGKKESTQMMGEKQSGQTQIDYCYTISLIKIWWKVKNCLVRWQVKNSQVKPKYMSCCPNEHTELKSEKSMVRWKVKNSVVSWLVKNSQDWNNSTRIVW
jgi:hypothetical protein